MIVKVFKMDNGAREYFIYLKNIIKIKFWLMDKF